MGSLVSTRRIIVSSSNHSRLEAASEYLETLLGHSEVLALAPTRGATDDFVRGVSDRTGALYGVHRLTPIQLAASLATECLARAGLARSAGLVLRRSPRARCTSAGANSATLRPSRTLRVSPGLSDRL